MNEEHFYVMKEKKLKDMLSVMGKVSKKLQVKGTATKEYVVRV
jgi:hypothetical protein